MFKIFVTVLVLLVTRNTSQKKCDIEEYYWKDFEGNAPNDAFAGGVDAKKQPIFIGQTFISQFLLPTKIYETEAIGYYVLAGKEGTATENIKILCTKQPQNFNWIQTSNQQIFDLKRRKLVLAGFEGKWNTYIGRVKHEKEVLVGKIIFTNNPATNTLHVSSKGKVTLYKDFEILEYKLEY